MTAAEGQEQYLIRDVIMHHASRLGVHGNDIPVGQIL